VDDLLEVSRITRGMIELRKERVDLATVFAHALETSQPLIEAGGHTVTASFPPAPLWLDADPVRIAQVLSNLLNNAAKYMDRGGNIQVAAERRGDEAVVRIRDEGIGIAPEHLPHVFDLFSQIDRSLNRSQSGLGIGLALVRSLVEMHGGQIEANSEGLDQGSEFIVALPLAPPQPERATQPDAPASALLSSCRILVVDDNRDAADTLALLAAAWGAEVRVAYDGARALEVVPAFNPDVVLLDLGMPGMDGYEVARRVRRLPDGRDIQLIAVTGWGEEKNRQLTRDAGFDHHLVKPVAFSILRELLASVAQKR
jgi:CheY-like chemotaxis protein/two-component sensor histidine kinase